jgi:NADH-quinone oxidoreductase subunit L
MNASWLLPASVLAPALAFLVCAVIASRPLSARSERVVTRATEGAAIALFFTTLLALVAFVQSPGHVLVATMEALGDAAPPLVLDITAAPLLALTAVFAPLIALFSRTYLHREPGHARFFLLFNLFITGMVTMALGGTPGAFFAGWEMVGLSSALLIGYFDAREAPVRAGLRVLGTYRACDIGLLVAVLVEGSNVVHGKTPFSVMNAHAGVIAAGLLLAAMGKSAQLPFGGWLPRAMEGPTPSSAIFYGALSVHAGVFLLIRAEPWMHELGAARLALGLAGAATAAYGAACARAQSDAKSALAYAVMTQTGLMFVELALGLPMLALAHLTGHACLRAWQLLRAPSVGSDARAVRDALGHTPPRPASWPRMLSASTDRRLQFLALQGFFADAHVDRIFLKPLVTLARTASLVERTWLSVLNGPAIEHPPTLAERRSHSEVRS